MKIQQLLKKQITRKFFWTTILWLIYTFLRGVDLVITKMMLEVGFGEAHPLSRLFIGNTPFAIFFVILQSVLFLVPNLMLWYADKKTERFIDKITIIYAFILFTSVIVSIWVVFHNLSLFFEVMAR